MLPVVGERTTAVLMDEMRLFAHHDRASIPSLHLLRTLWVHSQENGIHVVQPTTSHVITTVDVRRCAHAISYALQTHEDDGCTSRLQRRHR